MSEEASHGNLWQNHSCDFLNSDSNSGGSGGEKLGEKPPDSSSNSPVENRQGMALVGRKRGRRAKASDGGGGESEHETHIWTERERRKKMRNMFSGLHALLPQLPPKADKSTIVDEAVNYIKTLQNSLIKLQKQRHEMQQGATAVDCEQSIITSQALAPDTRETSLPAGDRSLKNYFSLPTNKPNLLSVPSSSLCFQTWFSPNVVVSMCGNDAHISVCSSRKPGLLATIFYILEKHKLDVLSAHISSTQQRSIYMIHAHASGVSDDQLPKGLTVEEIFKLAVGEMTLWLSSC
ncbi:transcription factor bHLH95-like [Vitis riparia]|uniref:transcription factor bHLH95-like n=1 Tax=Vitis riparia TaxID=96939 RepID=UPI00155ACCEC|nr:transcription factor bHLH95-like [Vitis riparia]